MESNNITCPVCLKDFGGMDLELRNLTQLSCSHIYCTSCFNVLVRKAGEKEILEVDCPYCRKVHQNQINLKFISKPRID